MFTARCVAIVGVVVLAPVFTARCVAIVVVVILGDVARFRE